jgi:hypothetical protein
MQRTGDTFPIQWRSGDVRRGEWEGLLGRSDPSTPDVISSQDRPGTPHDAGRTRLGPSQHITLSAEPWFVNDRIDRPSAYPQHSSPSPPKGAVWCGRRCIARRPTTPTGHNRRDLGDLECPLSRLRTVRFAQIPVIWRRLAERSYRAFAAVQDRAYERAVSVGCGQ